ncbi:MAG: type II secretion system protein GspN [Desulfobacteraceae bacterium]|nr:type II secretion system protein GspN [Desulfobacteraceae bacterium]
MKKRLAYAGYIIGVTVLCLYFLFPSDAVTSYINYKINSISPDVKWTLHGVKPAFPPGLSSDLLEVSLGGKKIIGAEKVKVAPSLISLLTIDKDLRITGDTCDGTVDAKLIVSGAAHAPKIDINAVIDGIQISSIPSLKELKLCQVSGAASGTVVFSNREAAAGKGNARVKITDSQIRFTPALFGITQVTFKAVTAEFALVGEQVTLKRLDIDSREVSGTATGSMTLMKPIGKSLINITGEATPHPGILKQLGNQFPVELISGMKTKTGGIPFRISGSVEQPNFSLK